AGCRRKGLDEGQEVRAERVVDPVVAVGLRSGAVRALDRGADVRVRGAGCQSIDVAAVLLPRRRAEPAVELGLAEEHVVTGERAVTGRAAIVGGRGGFARFGGGVGDDVLTWGVDGGIDSWAVGSRRRVADGRGCASSAREGDDGQQRKRTTKAHGKFL